MQAPFNGAAWVWHPQGAAYNQTIDFLIDITVGDPAACHICLSVNSHYALYVNGTFAANDQFPDYENWKAWDDIPLAALVAPGANTLCLSAYWQGEESLTVRPYPAGAAFAVWEGEKLLAASGAHTPVRINTRWAADGVEKITPQLAYSFRYDATAALPAPVAAAVQPVDWPLHPRPIHKLCIDAPAPVRVAALGHFEDTVSEGTAAVRMQAAALCAGAPADPLTLPADGPLTLDNMVLLDLGSEQVGYFEMDIELPKECDVYIGWGEHLEDLRVRTHIGVRNFAAVWHGGAGRSRFFYPFKRMGLRYVQLHVYAPGARLYYAGVRPARYPLARVNLFECADHLHGQIYRTSLRTLLHCMHDHYEDCPWREQALYTMDSRNQMLCGYYAFEEYDFAKASLRMLGLSLRADHTLELTSPGKTSITIPSFTVIYLIQMGEYLRCSDDTAFAQEMLPVVQDIADGLLARVEPCGLIRRFRGAQYWNFYEWQTGLEGGCGHEKPEDQQDFDAPLNAFASMGLAGAAGLCERLGRAQDAARYRAAAAALAGALEAFWQPEKGWYATTRTEHGELRHACELTQALAVCCGAVPRARLEQVLRTLCGGMGEAFYPVTISHSIFKYEALLRLPAVYGRFVFDEVARVFGGMLADRATTFWETADGASAFSNAGSLCHAWSAIPAYLYLRYCVDSRGEGGALTVQQSGVYEPRLRAFADASRRIVDDDWPAGRL